MKTLILLFLCLQIAAPGQSPPGQYPPGQSPAGRVPPEKYPGPSIPKRSKKDKDKPVEDNSKEYEGVVSAFDAKTLEIAAEDHRNLMFELTETTTKPEKLSVGDSVEVKATQDERGGFHAISIRTLKAASPQAATGTRPAGPPTSSGETEDTRPTTMVVQPVHVDDPDDNGPPKLKRGIPEHRKKEIAVAEATPLPTAPAPPPEPATEAPPAPKEGSKMALLEKARNEVGEFLTGLPNFICQQFTTRYEGEGKKPNWKAIDVISANLIYEDHKERYEHMAVNGKPLKKKPEETGAWSTGQFAVILDDLFSPSTAARFHYVGERTIARQSTAVYGFEVDLSHSHWKVWTVGQYIMPAYRGSIWIAKESGEIRRVEMGAIQIPKEFPMDAAEAAVDYDYVSLGTHRFLLPVRAEMLSCLRGTATCSRNVIEFRAFHKFSGESNIIFDDTKK